MSATRFPRAIRFIMWNEAAERFTFYGMKAILTTFLVTHFFNPQALPGLQDAAKAKANEQTHLFITLAYAASIIGAFAADWFIGKYRTVLYLSLVYVAGIVCQTLFSDDYSLFMCGVYLIALGSGGIKPCVSANVGDQFTEENRHLLPKAFSLFYFCINCGSFCSTLLIPLVYVHYGPALAFGIPGVLMSLAIIVFAAGRRTYIKIPPRGFPRENFIRINAYALLGWMRGRKGKRPLLDIAKDQFSAEAVDGIRSVWRILAVFAFIPVFWALYDQNSSEWVLQATQLDLDLFGYTLLPQQVQAINPVLILVFIPLFGVWLFPRLEAKGIVIRPLYRIGAGLLFTLAAFLVIYRLQLWIDAGQRPWVGWQLLAYLILTIGEVLVNLTGLQYAYDQAPQKMKSTIMAFWMLTVAVGNYFVSLVNGNIAAGGFLSHLHGASYYLFFSAIMAVTCLLYFLVVRRLGAAKKDAV
jgi:POT family proton-dependent oligopeptide transporter